MNALVDLLATRTLRERILLSVMAVLGLPLLVYVTVLDPVAANRAAALSARDDALALNAWVADRAAEVPTQTELPPEEPGVIGSTGIEMSLRDSGLRASVSTLTEDSSGVITLRFDSVTFTTLATWLKDQSGRWGYVLTQFRFVATDAPGKVSASLTLEPEI